VTGWVLLLRGINVGGHGKLPMPALAALLETLGARQVTTHVQSGNAVFSGVLDAASFAGHIEDEIERAHGIRPAALVYARETFEEIAAGYPWPEAWAVPKTGHVWFLTAPSSAAHADFAPYAAEGERFELSPRAFYLMAPNGIGRSKLATIVERRLGVPATARNLNTVKALGTLLAALED
jgi:uncharacterized protein (DUF1697 family)